MASTSFVRTGFVKQAGSGQGLKTGEISALLRTEGATFTGEGTPIMSSAINRGATTAVASEYEASNGTLPYENGKDAMGAAFAPLAAVLRRSSLVAPVDVEVNVSVTLTDGATMSNGKTGVTIVQTGGLLFSEFFGKSGFPVRVSEDDTNPENNRIFIVERAFDDGGNGTLEMLAGCTSGSAADPGITVNTFWGQPAVTTTAVLRIQFGQQSVPGVTITQMTLTQEFGDVMDEYHSAADVTFGDATTTFAAGTFIKTDVSWIGGKLSAINKINPTLPPFSSSAVDPVVNGAVAEGDVTMAITTSGATDDVKTGDKFTVAGRKGVYEFLQDATAITNEIAAPSGDFFRPGAPVGGFTDLDVISIVHGPSFTPEFDVSTVLSKSRGDGSANTGGLTHAALVTHVSDKSVLLNCGGGGYAGFTGGTFVISSGNSGNDDPLCTARKRVTPGTIVPTASVDLQLLHDIDDRATTLTKLGSAGLEGENFFFMFAWTYPLQGTEILPALEGWCSRNAISDFFAFAAGAKDSTPTATMPLTMGESVNTAGDPAEMLRHFFIPAVTA